MTMVVLAWVIAIPLLGALTGARAMTPMAILCWFSYAGHLEVHRTWPFWTTKLVTAIIFSVLAVGELIGDKLPATPNRTSPVPLIARIVFGGLVGAIAATGLHGSVIEGAFLGSISAVVGAFLGFHLRLHLVTVEGAHDLPVALAEDVIVIGLSVLAMGIITG